MLTTTLRRTRHPAHSPIVLLAHPCSRLGTGPEPPGAGQGRQGRQGRCSLGVEGAGGGGEGAEPDPSLAGIHGARRGRLRQGLCELPWSAGTWGRQSAKILAKKPADLALFVPAQTDGVLFWKLTEGKKPMPSFKKDRSPSSAGTS